MVGPELATEDVRKREESCGKFKLVSKKSKECFRETCYVPTAYPKA